MLHENLRGFLPALVGVASLSCIIPFIVSCSSSTTSSGQVPTSSDKPSSSANASPQTVLGRLSENHEAVINVPPSDASAGPAPMVSSQSELSLPTAQQAPSAQSEESLNLPEQELTLGGFSIGDESRAVIRELGQPRQSSDGYYSQLEYPGFTILLDEEIVIGMTSTSNQYCTPAGVCPGMNFTKVRELYGEPLVSNRENGQFVEYYTAESSCWLQIALNGEQVKLVSVVCQP